MCLDQITKKVIKNLKRRLIHYMKTLCYMYCTTLVQMTYQDLRKSNSLQDVALSGVVIIVAFMTIECHNLSVLYKIKQMSIHKSKNAESS